MTRAAQDLAGLFWPRFMEVDGYVLGADHFHVPAARPEAVGQACRHITQAWRDALESTFPRA